MSNPNATIDIVGLTGSGKQAGRTITVSASCELMHNQLPASVIDPGHTILAAQDSAGSPLLLSIGADQCLRLFWHDASAAGGWGALELSATMSAYTHAVTFDMRQDLRGRISVAVAMQRKDGGTDVLYAALLSADMAQSDWKNFSTLAKPVAGLDPAFAATQLILGPSDDNAAALLSVAGVIGAQQHYYLLSAPTAAATLMNFPEDLGANPQALIALANGYAFGQRGIWFLYTLGASQTLECTTFASADMGSMVYDYSPGNRDIPADMRYTCMALPTGSAQDAFSISSDVYVGTRDGVYLFRGAHGGKPEVVAQGLVDVRQILVCTAGNRVSVWAIASPSELWYISGAAGVANAWNAPVLFSNDCLHMAPIRSSANQRNELFMVNSGLEVVHAVQDPQSTLWHQSTIKVANKNFLFNAETYTSVLQFSDDQGTPLAGQTVRLSASDWIYATVNGRMVSLDLDAPASIATDATGKVTVIVPTADISTPILHLSSDLYTEVVNVYPNGRVFDGLGRITSGADLKAATAQGAPVLDPATDDSTADGMASNISQITAAGVQTPDGARAPGALYLSIGQTKHSGALDVRHLPASFAAGMQLKAGAWVPMSAPLHASTLLMANSLDSIAMDLGDALHWLEHTLEDGLKAIVQGVTTLKDGASFLLHKLEDGLSFVFTLAGKVLTIALKTFGALLKALNFLLKLVGIDLKKILAWLGHLLGWDTIWDTHKILAAMLNNGLAYADQTIARDLASLRSDVLAVLGTLRTDFDKLVLPTQAAAIVPRQTASGMPAGAQHSAPANLAAYQMQHGGMLRGTTAAGAGTPTLSNLAGSLLPSLLGGVLDDLAKLADDAIALCTKPENSVDTVRHMLVDLLDLMLDPLVKIINALFDVLAELVTAIGNDLRAEADIPFLSEFYAFITDLLGDQEDFTVINGAALLLAIPVVEMSRAFGVGAPFDGVSGFDAPDLFTRLAGGAPVPKLRAMLATPAGEPEPSGVSQLAHDYSSRGGIVGSIVAILENIGLLLTSIDEDSGGPAEGPKATAQKIVLAISLIRFSATFPLRDDDYPEQAYRLKVAGWSIALAGTLLTLGLKLRAPLDEKIEGSIAAVTNGLTLAMLLVGDGLSDEQQALAWCTDIASCGGGVALGIGTASNDPYVTAAGLGFCGLGSVFGIALAVKLAPDQVGHFVNVGG